jgi:hypothetical protein
VPTLAAEDFAGAFGIDRLSEECRALVAERDFSFAYATAEEHDALVLDTVRKLDARAFSTVGEHRRDVWQRGWSENLREFQASGFEAASLLPKYFGTNPPFLRFRQRYIRPASATFEIDFYTVLRTWLFREYLATAAEIHELGCGTGLNLMLLAKLFPEKPLHGADWAPASVDIVAGLARKYGWRLNSRLFDFFQPDPAYPLSPGSAVLTMDALEQVGDRHAALLDYLVARRPSVCIHVEPVLEFYDDANLLDYLAIRYHRERSYLSGFLPALRERERKGSIKILLGLRTHFGGLYNESYSIIVWRPA